MIRKVAIAFAIVAVSAGSARAEEDEFSKADWPLAVIERPLTLAGGMVELRGDTFIADLSSGNAFGRLSLAPDIYYGVSPMLSVGITHGLGICLDGCASTYNDVGLDARYGFMRGGSFQVAVHGGLLMPSLDPFDIGVNAGLQARVRAGKVAVVVDPTVGFIIADRDRAADFLSVPAQLQLQVQPQTMIALVSGIVGPLDGFGDGMMIPAGIDAVLAANNRLDFGAGFRFLDVADTFDDRELIVRVALRL